MKCHMEYTSEQAKRIEENFVRLKDIHYLDHAGATQYADEQMQKIYANFVSNVYCNPHTSKVTEDLVDQVRYKVLGSFNTTIDDYSVIFTSGTTASLKLVAETFDFSNDGRFSYLRDNHTSVLGMREIVNTNNINCVERDQFMNDEFGNSFCSNEGNSLFVFPAQCNFNGFKYPMEKIEHVQTNNNRIDIAQSNSYVCLDAASFVSTNYLDLKRWRPDFVCISFYKMFGYPSGLGALLVSRRGEQLLNKSYYGGGTVKISMSNATGWHCKRDLIHERFEDGTIPYLSIISLLAGYETIEKLIPGRTMERISQHCFNLCQYLYESLKHLKYPNGNNVIRFYHDTNFKLTSNQGGIINFNIMHEGGTYVGFSEVANIATLHNIFLRTGCFCNPGACQRHLKLSDEDLRAHFKAGHVCGDDNDLINGVPTGSIRISVGYMTTYENIDAIIKLITDCYCSKSRVKYIKLKESLNNNNNNNNGEVDETDAHAKTNVKKSHANSSVLIAESPTNGLRPQIRKNSHPLQSKSVENNSMKKRTKSDVIKLHEICIFPIKSCAALRVDTNWPINRRGLKYDREWMIVRSTGVAMTQKSDTKLCLIRPSIDESENTLTLSFPYVDDVRIPLKRPLNDNKTISSLCQSKICGDRIEGFDCGDEVAAWLSDILCSSGLRLIQQTETDKRTSKNGADSQQEISLSNQAQFLLINVASVDWLTKKVNDWVELDDCAEKMLQNTIDRFRANLIVESSIPLEEMEWKSIKIGGVQLKVTGPCTRCQMICIDQSTGEKTTEPLQTIGREFQGKMRFGIYLCQCDEKTSGDAESIISCDDVISIEK